MLPRPSGYPILDSWKRRIKTSITLWDLIESSRIQTEPEKAHFHPSYLTIEEHSIIRHGQHQRSRRPPDTRTRRILTDCRYTCEVDPRSAAPPSVFGIHKHHDPSYIGRIMARPVAGFHILTRAARWCYTCVCSCTPHQQMLDDTRYGVAFDIKP